MTTEVLLYHGNCPDGIFGAYACWKKYGSAVRYFPMRYVQKPDENDKNAIEIYEDYYNIVYELCQDKHVVMVDFATPFDITKRLLEICKSLMILDHHKTAQINLKEVPDSNKIFDMSHSGCYLSHKYFFPEKDVPKEFLYIEDRDIWKWSDPDSDPFTTALSAKIDYCVEPGKYSEYFINLRKLTGTSEAQQELISYGKIVLEYKKKLCEDAVNSAKPIKIKNPEFVAYKGMIVNSSVFASEIGNILSSKKDCDFAIVYKHDIRTDIVDNKSISKQYYQCSIRSDSDECDVSVIAKSFGGGGHARASGFYVENLLDHFDYIKK